MLLGLVLLFQGDLAQAHVCLEECLAVSREVGYKRNLGLSIHFLGMVAWVQGDVARARSLLEESLVLVKEAGGGDVLLKSLPPRDSYRSVKVTIQRLVRGLRKA
jgi:hypothetical protein